MPTERFKANAAYGTPLRGSSPWLCEPYAALPQQLPSRGRGALLSNPKCRGHYLPRRGCIHLFRALWPANLAWMHPANSDGTVSRDGKCDIAKGTCSCDTFIPLLPYPAFTDAATHLPRPFHLKVLMAVTTVTWIGIRKNKLQYQRLTFRKPTERPPAACGKGER
jgi:hypothetical protein